MKRLKMKSNVTLKAIPVSPNDDYMAGSDGQVYSRTKYAGFGRKHCVDWYPLAGHTTPKGYQSITLCDNNKRVTKNIHRLICMAFHGMPPKASMQVRHLDGNPSNNTPENLIWGSQEENWADREAHGRGMKGENHPMSKLTNEERSHIHWTLSKGLCSQRHAAKVLGMSQAAIYAIAHSS